MYNITHGNCPDGVLSAYLLKRAAEKVAAEENIELLWSIIHSCHGKEMLPKDIKKGSIVVFSDCCPELADINVIAKMSAVVVIDHHASSVALLGEVKDSLAKRNYDSFFDFSVFDQNQCGASLVVEFCKSSGMNYTSEEKKIIEYHWHLDVFDHELIGLDENEYKNFKAYVRNDC